MICNKDLQAHVHYIGLEEFLKQLEEVFQEAMYETEDICTKKSAQYENARWEVNAARHRIFYDRTSSLEKEVHCLKNKVQAMELERALLNKKN